MSTDSAEIGKAGLVVLIGTGLSMVSGFVFRVFLSNSMTPSGFGEIVLFLSLLNIISIPAIFGLKEGIVKFLSETESTTEQKHGYITISILVVALLSLALLLIGVLSRDILSKAVFGDNSNSALIVVLFLSLPIYSLNKVIRGVLRGKMQTTGFVKYSKLFDPISRLVLVFLVSFIASSSQDYGLALLASFGLTLIYGLYLLKRAGWQPKLHGIDGSKELLAFSLPLMISSSVFILLSQFDKVAIGYFQDSELVGVYEIAVTIAMLLGLFRTGFSFLLYPKISKKVSNGERDSVQSLYQNTTKWILGFTAPAYILLVVYPDGLIRLFGDHYSVTEVSPLIMILGFGMFVNAIAGPNGEAMLGYGRSRSVLVYNSLAVGINIILNLILIPTHGLIGAASASAIGYFTMNLMKSGDLYINYGIRFFSKYTLAMSIGCIGVGIIAGWLLPRGRTIAVYLPLAAIVFLICILVEIGILILMGGINEGDKDLLREVIPSELINSFSRSK